MDLRSSSKLSSENSSDQSMTETLSEGDVTILKSPKPLKSYESIISLQNEDDLNNKINLILSRKTTNKYDRKKVERFWKYFDKLNDEHKPTSSVNVKTETERDHCLCGTVEYKKKGIDKFAALRLLSLLKSEHLDRVVLQNAPPEHKVEGSPRLADEIFKETINTVNQDITTFQEESKQKNYDNIEKEPVRRDIKLLSHGKNYSSILNNPCLYE